MSRAIRKRVAQRRVVHAMQRPDDNRLGFFHVFRQQHRSQHGGNGERGDQRTGEGVTISAGHGAKDRAFDALHREQRHKSGNRDQRRKQNRLINLNHANEDQSQPVGPSVYGMLDLRPGLRAVGSSPESARPPDAPEQTLPACSFVRIRLEDSERRFRPG